MFGNSREGLRARTVRVLFGRDDVLLLARGTNGSLKGQLFPFGLVTETVDLPPKYVPMVENKNGGCYTLRDRNRLRLQRAHN